MKCQHYTGHWVSGHEIPLTLIIQRKEINGQLELETDESGNHTEMTHQGYLYRSIVTDHEEWTDRQIIHWYNQRR